MSLAAEQQETIEKINKVCGSPYTEAELFFLCSLDETAVMTILDSSIADLFPYSIFVGKRAECFFAWEKELLSPWAEFMLGEEEDNEFETPDFSLETYQKAMFLKNVLCFQKNPYKQFKIKSHTAILDIGGGLGFHFALFHTLSEHIWLTEKPDIIKMILNKTGIETHQICEGPFPRVLPRTYDIIHISEVLHGRTEKERQHWFNVIPTYLNKNGKLIITEVDPESEALYGKLFDLRIKLMTNGEGAAISMREMREMASKRFREHTSFRWDLLPYYTLIFEKK